ncbi:MAG: iron-sulfur cluster carrier protein ApbC [Alphaproteobacteria bacterium]|nr:iron-sulfur cluster carrier protein ApbC [Alphaproteobacteria bacterium]MCB1551314.1 iron-sulfur cluster carrier protein ApbC [Alphaproteobacteria bacterium]MCB9984183.1 iron-sulfur cluster carrier protein ApbC [Micavibrio sp.]
MFSFLKSKKSIPKPDYGDLREFVHQTVQFMLKDEDAFRLEDVQITKTGQAVVVIEMIGENDRKDNLANELQQKIKVELEKITGITKATIVMTSQKPSAKPRVTTEVPTQKIPDVKDIIAVSSGKGGVGKSTVAINLALAIAETGRKVGLLDADIYGPSIPRLAGISKMKAQQDHDGRLLPIDAHGLKIMSMGLMVDEDSPMIWRGPMAQSALLQMIRDVVWDGLDVLVIDMPPGTGDIHLTLAQRVPLSGGVIVSTPQDIALIDARKGLEMFRKVAVPILGIVENMSYFMCPECGHREDIFGHGGARDEATRLGVPFLGEIPLHARIRELSDLGTPVTTADPTSAQAKSFGDIAGLILSGLENAQRPSPKILIEE